jgi:hypothetical protein
MALRVQYGRCSLRGYSVRPSVLFTRQNPRKGNWHCLLLPCYSITELIEMRSFLYPSNHAYWRWLSSRSPVQVCRRFGGGSWLYNRHNIPQDSHIYTRRRKNQKSHYFKFIYRHSSDEYDKYPSSLLPPDWQMRWNSADILGHTIEHTGEMLTGEANGQLFSAIRRTHPAVFSLCALLLSTFAVASTSHM